MKKRNARKMFVIFSMVTILLLGSVITAYAASTVTINLPSNRSFIYETFYTSGGTVTFTFKANNNPNCHYECTITQGAYDGKIITEMEPVVGNGSDTAKVTVRSVAAGSYFATVRPINGATNGKTVTCTLTVSK